jgi:hypothetical protein
LVYLRNYAFRSYIIYLVQVFGNIEYKCSRHEFNCYTPDDCWLNQMKQGRIELQIIAKRIYDVSKIDRIDALMTHSVMTEVKIIFMKLR